MTLQGKALYNLLRMNWLNDRSVNVEPWQVEDYRELEEEELFERMADLEIPLERDSFIAYAGQSDSPEDLVEKLVNEDYSPEEQDQVYLLLFELWRRLLPEDLCLSLFCDELDHQIFLYDKEETADPEAIQSALDNLQELLEDNTDEGAEPHEVFQQISEGCANDLESFLYDFTLEQIEDDSVDYASELIEGFSSYLEDDRWFLLLEARVAANRDLVEGNRLLRDLFEDLKEEPSLELSLEMLAWAVQGGERDLVHELVEAIAPLLGKESEFQELLALCIDYFNCLDCDQEEAQVQALFDGRQSKDEDGKFVQSDTDLQRLVAIMASFSQSNPLS